MTERPAPNYSDAERELRRVEEKEAHRTIFGPGCIEIEGTMTSHFPGVPIPGPLGLVDGIVAILRLLDSDEARAALLSEVLARVCRYCGSMLDDDRRCYCEDDE